MGAILLSLLLLQAIGLNFASPVSPVQSPLKATASLWDVIVIGAGPAGTIVASRLSESGTKKVLLLEGGGPSYFVTGGTERPQWLVGNDLSRVDVPGLYNSIFSTPTTSLTCGKNLNAFGGCTLGGSGAINAGLFFEPPASDFDKFFPAGWKHADLQPSITKLYKTEPSTDNPSQDGIRYLQSGYTVAKKWLVTNAGYSELKINANAAKKTKVFGHPAYNYYNAQRSGPVINYLQAALKRSNFGLQRGAWAQRVVRTGSVATGVVANVSGVITTYSLSSRGRVVISGGALKSPELLMKSGIGDPAVLTRLHDAKKLGGLPVTSWINSTAVGAGLFDNPNTFIELSSPDIESYVYSYDNPPAADKALYLQHRSGPYSFPGQTSVFWDYVKRADGSLAGMQGTIGSAGFRDYTSNQTVTLNIYGTSGLKSTGKVVLDSNFIAGPSGDVYYSNPQDAQDIATFIHGIFAALPGSSLTPLNIPQSATHQEIVEYITTWSAYARGQVNHWSSSCRIGSCVDTNTTVLGTKNIHVVDGSIVAPLTVNPQMGIMIAAERASELIGKLL